MSSNTLVKRRRNLGEMVYVIIGFFTIEIYSVSWPCFTFWSPGKYFTVSTLRSLLNPMYIAEVKKHSPKGNLQLDTCVLLPCPDLAFPKVLVCLFHLGWESQKSIKFSDDRLKHGVKFNKIKEKQEQRLSSQPSLKNKVKISLPKHKTQ